VIIDLLNLIVVAFGLIWAYRNFNRRREDHPKIQFDADVNFLAKQDGKIVTEILLLIENKGLVRHFIDPKKFTIQIYFIDKYDKIEESLDLNSQVVFKKLGNERLVVPKNWFYTFIDPGIVQNYSYIANISENASVVMIKAKFKYRDIESDFHGLQKAFHVPDNFHTLVES
jgi:hypothetical protein